MKNKIFMINRFFGSVLIVLIIALSSCNKEEGTGGEGSIKGVVYIKEYLSDGNVFIRQIPAPDEDVFIIYGSGSSVGDKVVSSNNGNFEFSNLRDGSYKIYAYSDDSLLNKNNKHAIMIDVSIDNGKSATADTLFIIKYLNNEGTGQIYGKLFIKEYDKSFKYFQRIIPATGEDVFLCYANNSLEINRVRTSYNGSYLFDQLGNDSYKVYVFQDDTAMILKKSNVISPEIKIENGNKIELDTLFAYKGLDVDEGNATISGKITLLNYKSDLCSIKDVGPAQDYDVFLVYGDHIVYDLDTKTDNDGEFSFSNLIKGKYTVFVYSQPQDEFGCLIDQTEKSILKSDISITIENQMIDTIKFITKKL
jgi:hypothetical protein